MIVIHSVLHVFCQVLDSSQPIRRCLHDSFQLKTEFWQLIYMITVVVVVLKQYSNLSQVNY